MTFSINTNNASIEALASLRMTNASLTTTENQLSTGKKVNSASDDPAIYAVGECAEHGGQCIGLVAPSFAQAEAAADDFDLHDCFEDTARG